MDAPFSHFPVGQNQSENRDFLLWSSICYFVKEYPNSISSLSNLVSTFHRAILHSKDPSLEMLWFYGAVAFHKCNQSFFPPKANLMFANDFLELLKSHLCSSSRVKKVAVIAPVLYILYTLHFHLSVKHPSLRKMIEIVVEKIVSHISICCDQCVYEGDLIVDRLDECTLDLVRAWTVDRIRINNKINVLKCFFPVLNNAFQREVTMSMGYLVGVVMNEALLLRLCLKISPEVDKEVLRQDMLNLAIRTINGFRNFYFLDMLLNMLLEPSLPVAASLSSEDAVLLRKTLYDAVILIDYSFYSWGWAHSDSINQSKKLSLLWVLAIDHAVKFARDTKDEAKAVSYLNAFRESQMVTELIKWVNSRIGVMHPNTLPEITTPRALMHWLLALEDKYLVLVFEFGMSLLRAKAVACVKNKPPQQRLLQTHNVNAVQVNEDQEINGQLNNGIPGDLCLGKDGGKKGKEPMVDVEESSNRGT